MDLRKFIDQLQTSQQLKSVIDADWDLEIGTITELSDERFGPALLFDQIKGFPRGYRVATNLTATPKRQALAFGLSEDVPPAEVVQCEQGQRRFAGSNIKKMAGAVQRGG